MPNEHVARVSRLLHRTVGHQHKPYSKLPASIVQPPTISTEAVDFKAPLSAKSGQAWKYSGGKVLRAASTQINGTTYTDPKHPGEALPRRKQESNFFITINSNQGPSDAGSLHTAMTQMETMLRHLSDDKQLATYLRFGPKSEHYAEDLYKDVIHSVSWKAAVETGDVMKRVHSHIWLTVTHYSQIQINVHALMHLSRKFYNEAGTSKMTKNPYVHVKLLPQSDWTDVMRQYIHKGMAAAESTR
jgi:hypothetical protein